MDARTADAGPHDQTRGWRPERCDRIALVLQGGGALGAYQAGVYEALHEANIEPDYVSGVSIGAINSAIIAGNSKKRRLERLRTFWERITERTVWHYTPDGDVFRKARNAASSWLTLMQGQPGFFKPRNPGPWMSLAGATTATSYYDRVAHHKKKIVVVFEGRDSAGKGGVIKRITQRLNPRICRVAALPAPSERERSQWYFQRYAAHLPSGGEMVLFDRSWYNRAGVERVMGFCNETDVSEFFRSVPEFERMLVRSGIMLFKYWFSITDDEQQFRFMMRIHDPLKQWKLSPMDVESRARWEHYTKAKEEMLEKTHIPEAPWWIVDAVDKKRARLNCISHLLSQIPYDEVARPTVVLPERVRNPDYHRGPVPTEMYVPSVY